MCVRRVQREERGEQHGLEVGGVEALEVPIRSSTVTGVEGAHSLSKKRV